MRRIVLASSLTNALNDVLGGHPAVERVIPCPGQPWQVPDGAEALFTYMSQWPGAPSEPPPGWPFALRWIQVASVGVDTFPAWIHSVARVTRVEDVQSTAIAEYAIAAVMAHEKQFFRERITGPAGWRSRRIGNVAGRRIGVAGMGAIGREIARIASAVGMSVSAFVRTPRAGTDGIEFAPSLPALFASCDHVILAMPLTAQTRSIVDHHCLAGARPGLHLVNVARGALIDDTALLEALDSGKLAAATLDVTDPEPLPDGHPFYSHPAIRLTPHCAGATQTDGERMSQRLLANLDAYVSGVELAGVFDPRRGY